MGIKVVLANAFSLNMLDEPKSIVLVKDITESQAKRLLTQRIGFISAVGHKSTADLLSKRLHLNVQPNRIMVKLDESTLLVIAQVMKRLPEGTILTKEELKQVPIQWKIVAKGVVGVSSYGVEVTPQFPLNKFLAYLGINPYWYKGRI